MKTSSTLLERIAQGDRSAVALCIKRYQGLVWTLVRRSINNEADAEELVQEIFIELWKKAEQFNPAKAEEVTFVSMLTRRRLVDRLRKQGREPEKAPLSQLELDPGEDNLSVLEQSAETQRVFEVIKTLEPEQREVIKMSAWLGMSHSAIAGHIGMPLGTVKSHLRRGLIRIRKELGEARLAGDGVSP